MFSTGIENAHCNLPPKDHPSVTFLLPSTKRLTSCMHKIFVIFGLKRSRQSDIPGTHDGTSAATETEYVVPQGLVWRSLQLDSPSWSDIEDCFLQNDTMKSNSPRVKRYETLQGLVNWCRVEIAWSNGHRHVTANDGEAGNAAKSTLG